MYKFFGMFNNINIILTVAPFDFSNNRIIGVNIYINRRGIIDIESKFTKIGSSSKTIKSGRINVVKFTDIFG